MKRFFLLAAICCATLVQAQTADEIIQKYTASMGGLDGYNTIKTAKFTGSLSQSGLVLPVTTQIVNNKAMRLDIEIMGTQIISVYNNGKGWKQNQFDGFETPTEMTAAELADTKPQASLASELMDYKARGHKVELQGKENVEGVECYKITLVSAGNNKTTTYFLDTATYTLIKSVTPRVMQDQSVEVETFYSDLKEFGGVKFAMKRIQKIMGQMFMELKLDKVELGVTIDPSIFEM